MSMYALLDDTANTVCTVVEENPDDALERLAKDVGKALTFDGDGPAPYVLRPLDQLSSSTEGATWIDPERPVYLRS